MPFIRDTWTSLLRLLRTFTRSPFYAFIYLVQPLIWLLLFTQIFKSLTALPNFPTSSYVQFFAPGLIVTLAVFNSNFTGFALLNDINFGVLEKVLVTPVNRYSLILGTVLYVAVTGVLQIAVVLIISFALGATLVTGVGGILVTIVIVSLLGIGLNQSTRRARIACEAGRAVDIRLQSDNAAAHLSVERADPSISDTRLGADRNEV